ncbi:MAG: hypothetical protein Ta2D_14050 [Rickettsiales bacterium]|nr:MAG: hypothetical protein Ta2D_14050 [Rickettsiales bacterium]
MEFKGARSLILLSKIKMQMLMLFTGRYMLPSIRELTEHLDKQKIKESEKFELFIKENFNNEVVINSMLNFKEWEEQDIFLVLSFLKDTNNIPYSRASIECLKASEIKDKMKYVLTEFISQNLYIYTSNEKVNLQQNIKNSKDDESFENLFNKENGGLDG